MRVLLPLQRIRLLCSHLERVGDALALQIRMTLANDSLARVTVRTTNKVSSPHQQDSCTRGFLLMRSLLPCRR
jgi:hypothetical protein